MIIVKKETRWSGLFVKTSPSGAQCFEWLATMSASGRASSQTCTSTPRTTSCGLTCISGMWDPSKLLFQPNPSWIWSPSTFKVVSFPQGSIRCLVCPRWENKLDWLSIKHWWWVLCPQHLKECNHYSPSLKGKKYFLDDFLSAVFFCKSKSRGERPPFLPALAN